MSESEKQFESKEQPKTKIVHIEYGEYSDQQHEVLEMPTDWDLDELQEQFKRERNGKKRYGDEHLFVDWLIERGAKNDVAEKFYIYITE